MKMMMMTRLEITMRVVFYVTGGNLRSNLERYEIGPDKSQVLIFFTLKSVFDQLKASIKLHEKTALVILESWFIRISSSCVLPHAFIFSINNGISGGIHCGIHRC